MAHSVRAAEWPTLLVAGNSSIHAAVKCCITAGRFLHAEGLAIEFEPRFREADHSRALLALCVLSTYPGAAPPPGAGLLPFEIKVSTHSRHAKVGAALSARLVEEGGRAVVLLALGETAVANAVMATAHAGHYLASRNGLRLVVQASTAFVVKEGDQLNGVALAVRLQVGGEGGNGAAGGGGAPAAVAPAPGAGAGGLSLSGLTLG